MNARTLNKVLLPAGAALLASCIYLPRTTEVYDASCAVTARHMTMELHQVGAIGRCQGQRCAELLVAAGAVGAVSAVVSGSIVVTGNVVYWFEKQGRCMLGEIRSSG